MKIIFYCLAVVQLLVLRSSYANDLECWPPHIDGKAVPGVFNMRVYDNVVSFKWNTTDKTLCEAYKEQGDFVFLKEYIPKGQNLSNWQEMFSIRAFYDSVVSNHQLISFYASNRVDCKTYKSLVSKETKDSLEITSVCGSYHPEKLTDNINISEIIHYVVKKTNNTTYTFFYSKRGKPFDASKYNFDNKDLKKWSKFLNSIKLSPANSAHS